MRVLVTGATGFVGRRLCPALRDAGHEVRAMTRRPGAYSGIGQPVYGDVADPESVRDALRGCDASYYLVHSLGRADFPRRDARAAADFAGVAAASGLRRIVYLGGLGDDTDALSDHLRSRREVEGLLGSTGVPVTTLRAGIVIGHGGTSWELTHQLVEHVPAMLTPTWVHTRTQPIAVTDMVRYLVGVLDAPEAAGRAFDVGGPEVLSYLDMIRRIAVIQGRNNVVVPVPLLGRLLSPPLSWFWPASSWLSLGLRLVTDVDPKTSKTLIGSMGNEMIAREHDIRSVVPFTPMDYDQAVLAALGERAAARRAA